MLSSIGALSDAESHGEHVEDLRLPDIASLCNMSYLACVKGNRIMMHRWLGQVWQAEKIW